MKSWRKTSLTYITNLIVIGAVILAPVSYLDYKSKTAIITYALYQLGLRERTKWKDENKIERISSGWLKNLTTTLIKWLAQRSKKR